MYNLIAMETRLPSHSAEGPQIMAPVTMDDKLLSNTSGKVMMPPMPNDNEFQNNFIQHLVSVPDGGHILNNLTPLDGMKMENITMVTDPSVTMATNIGYSPGPLQDESNMEMKPQVKLTPGSAGTTAQKAIPVEDLEFDGNTVLCRVCGDKASGFHYGVHACEGCKGFFRRSIQQKIQYRPCLKNQMCNIMRVNRNRCQYCRLRKCIAVGMSRDAVRFGRVPKREKAKILEQMQKVNAQHQGNLLNDALGDPSEVSDRIIAAHAQYCDFTNSKFAGLFEKAWERPQFVDCPAHMACPLSPAQSEGMNKWDEFSNCFTPAIRNVVNFAKSIPGFSVFSQEDQVTLLKAGTFEVLLVHLACLFDSQTNTMMFTNGKLYRKLPQQGNTSAGFLLDSMFDFADRLNKLRLTDQEVALFSGLVVTAPDRPGLRYHDQIQRVHSVISHSLQKLMKINHPEEPATFSKLLMKIPDLRTLNSLHSEKLLGLTVPQNGRSSPSPEGEQIQPVNMSAGTEVPVQPKPEPCPMGSKSPSQNDFVSRSAGYPMMQMPIRCPMSAAETPSGHPNPLLTSQRPSMRPIVPHQVSMDPKDKELILQTPFGSFHRQSLYYAQFDPAMAAMMNMEAEISGTRKSDNPLNHVSPMTMATKATEVSEQNLNSLNTSSTSPSTNHQAKPALCSSPIDFIDLDIQQAKSTNPRTDLRCILGKESLMHKLDVRRMMLDPALPEVFRKRLIDSMDPAMTEGCRKRLLESIECEIDPKIAKLWDYDMRSSRSNSLSSSSSLESTDSAYRTISNPGTPRTHYEMVRSPYTNPADICTRLTTHTVTTPSTLARVTEERDDTSHLSHNKDSSTEGLTPDRTLPTLRKMLLGAQSNEAAKTSNEESTQEGSTDKDNKKCSNESKPDDSPASCASPDEHYFIHKKLKMKQSLMSDRNKYDGEFRSRAASFSTVVGKMRPHMAPPFIRPRSVEAPPRLTTKSPTKTVELSERTYDSTNQPVPHKPCITLPNKDTKLTDMPPTATFAAIVTRVMEAALTHEEEENKLKENAAENPNENPTKQSKVPEEHVEGMVPAKPMSASEGVSKQFQSSNAGMETNSNSGATSKVNLTSATSSHSSPPMPSRYNLTKPSERHPELLSRLTAGPQVNGLRTCPRTSPPGRGERSEFVERSRTPPPRLYPVQDSVRGTGSYTDHSPPSLLPVSQSKSNIGPRPATPDAVNHGNCHLTAISSLKDKILKRIDSQENLRLSPQQHAGWPGPIKRPEQHLVSRSVHSEASRSDEQTRITAHSSSRSTPDTTSRMRSVNGYNGSPRSSSSSGVNNPGGPHALSQYPPPNGAIPMALPPNSVGFFPGAGRLQPNMHPALLYNSAVHYQALQQLHAQAAQIQHQMAHISNMAAMNTMGHDPGSMESMVSKVDQHNEGRHGDNRPTAVARHSQHPTSTSRDSEPINLTKEPGILSTDRIIKPEPL